MPGPLSGTGHTATGCGRALRAVRFVENKGLETLHIFSLSEAARCKLLKRRELLHAGVSYLQLTCR